MDHVASDVEEAGVAEIARVVEKSFGRGGIGIEVDGPVHEGCCATNGKDDGVDVVHGYGFDEHGFGAGSPVGVNVGVSFGALGLVVDSLGVLSGEAEERPGGNV